LFTSFSKQGDVTSCLASATEKGEPLVEVGAGGGRVDRRLFVFNLAASFAENHQIFPRQSFVHLSGRDLGKLTTAVIPLLECEILIFNLGNLILELRLLDIDRCLVVALHLDDDHQEEKQNNQQTKIAEIHYKAYGEM